MSANQRSRSRSLTAGGAATRSRIVNAAADVIYEHGVERTSLDEVMAASGVSKSQLYHYFADKDALRVTGENQVEPIWDRFRKSPGSTVQQYDYL
jgi:AcrR family transcriptional regulator